MLCTCVALTASGMPPSTRSTLRARASARMVERMRPSPGTASATAILAVSCSPRKAKFSGSTTSLAPILAAVRDQLAAAGQVAFEVGAGGHLHDASEESGHDVVVP